MKQYIELLKSEPLLKRLSIIQSISYFAAWFSSVAIYTLLLQLSVSALIVATVASLHFIAGVIQAPFSGSIIDRVQPKRLMLTLLAIEIVATTLLLLVDNLSHIWLLFILVFIRMGAASFYFSAQMSLLPKIVSGKKLQQANEIHSIIWSTAYTAGMGVSGAVVFLMGVKIAFILDAALFVICLYLLYKTEFKVIVTKSTQTLLETMRDAFIYIKGNPLALHLMFLHAFVGLSAFDALVALMVDQYYSHIIAIPLALGLMHAARAFGLMMGPILLGGWINNRRVILLFTMQAICIWIWAAVMSNFYLSLLASVLVGFFTTILWSYTYTLLQHNIDEKYYGRVIAYNDMLFLISAALTSLGIGVLASLSYSLESIALLIGVGFMVAAVYYRWILKRYL